MRTAMVTSHTGHRRDGIAFVVLVEAKILFIDLRRHLEHMAGDVFFRFGIAAKIQVVRAAVRGRSMTKITFHAQRGFPTVHDLVQVFMTDVFGKDLEISFWLIVRGTGGCHTDGHQDSQRQCDPKFFTVKHKR